jgi:hypothetical protein
MGYGSGGGSSSTSISIPPGGKDVSQFAKKYLKMASPFVLGGDISSPVIEMLSNIVYSAGAKQANLERGQIEQTRGISQPAKAKMVGGLEDKVIQAAAGVPLEMYDKMVKFISGLMQPLQIGQSSTAGSTKYGL